MRQAKTPAAVGLTGVTLQHPYGLTVAPNGTLYIVDAGRDQVLRRLPNGRFKVVAGNGRAGALGDGGPATKAELRLQGDAGIVVAKNGTLYIADSRNRRVRAVLPNGTITTVAGDGHDGWLYGTSPALAASIGSVAGLAIGPNGDLYIAANNVVRLTTDGMLHWVAGARFDLGLPPCGGIECNPAGEVDLSEPDSLAFDAAGDLFVSDNNGFGLYEVAANGTLSYLGQFRGNGAPGALATAPNGIIEAGRFTLSRLTPHEVTPTAHDLGYQSRLDAALGGSRNQRNIFIAGDGVAVAPDGNIYADTNTGNTFTAVSALVQVSPDGRVTTLWKS